MGSMDTGRVARAQGPLRRWEAVPAGHECRDRTVVGEENRIVTRATRKPQASRSHGPGHRPQPRGPPADAHPLPLIPPVITTIQRPSRRTLRTAAEPRTGPSPQKSHLGNNWVANAVRGRRRAGACPRGLTGSGRDPHRSHSTRAARAEERSVRLMTRMPMTRSARGALVPAAICGPRMCCCCQAL